MKGHVAPIRSISPSPVLLTKPNIIQMLQPRAKSQTKPEHMNPRNRSVSPLNMKITGSRYRKRVAESPPPQRVSTSNMNVSRMSKNRGRSRIFESDDNMYNPSGPDAKQRLFGESVGNNNNTNNRNQKNNIGMGGVKLVNQTHANLLGEGYDRGRVQSQKGFTSMMRNRGDRSKSNTRILGKQTAMIQRTNEGGLTQTYKYPEYGGSYRAMSKIVNEEGGSQNQRYVYTSKSPKPDRVVF